MPHRDDERIRIQRRWDEIDRELEQIRLGRVTDIPPADREAQLLDELDRLEYQAGIIEYPRFGDEPDGKTSH